VGLILGTLHSGSPKGTFKYIVTASGEGYSNRQSAIVWGKRVAEMSVKNNASGCNQD